MLALSTPVDSIAANPRCWGRNIEQLLVLAKALELDPEELRGKLAIQSAPLRVPGAACRRRSGARHGCRKGEGHKRGIYRARYKRYYPAGEVFAHVMGFTDVDDTGQEGLGLRSTRRCVADGRRKLVLRDGRRQVVDDVENIRSPQAGNHLALSIDQRLQFTAYRELKAAVRRHQAISGSLVLLDVQSGEVLAMVNQPSFNPNGDSLQSCRPPAQPCVDRSVRAGLDARLSRWRPRWTRARIKGGFAHRHTSPGYFRNRPCPGEGLRTISA